MPVRGPIAVIVETGSKRVFASAAEWPGFARGGRDEASALGALIEYGPRYARVVSRTTLGFVPTAGASGLRVVERLRGNATTDFGAPGVPAEADAIAVGAADLARLRTLLAAGWRAFDAGVSEARGTRLRRGPRGGGRSLSEIVAHVRDAEAGYLSALGWSVSGTRPEASRAAALEGLAASARGAIAPKGPRGGVRWKPRFFVRRLMWHALDHLWEIEDRSAEAVRAVRSPLSFGPGSEITRVRGAMANPVMWFEIMGKDSAGLQRFYRDVFAWKMTPPIKEMGNYSMLERPATGIGGGIGEGDPRVSVYIEAADPQRFVDRAVAAGATLLMPVTQITPTTTIAMLLDPAGNTFGVMKPPSRQRAAATRTSGAKKTARPRKKSTAKTKKTTARASKRTRHSR